MNGNNEQSPTVTADVEVLAADVRQRWPEVAQLPERFGSLEQRLNTAEQSVNLIRRYYPTRPEAQAARSPRTVSEGLARRLAASVITVLAAQGRLEALSSVPSSRDAMVSFARENLGITTKAALTTTEIPLPDTYGREVAELIADFGVARRLMTRYPIGMGTAKPARMGTRPTFGSIAMSGAFPERSPSIEFASLESHKLGGIVRVPREIDEQSIVAMGAFLARYGAVEFARAEDTWAFLADGSGTYDGVKGVVQIARDNGKTVTLAAGKTKPSDVTLADLRALRTKVSKYLLGGRDAAWKFDSTWETFLPTLNTAAEPNVYQRLPDGSAKLDGYPIIWVNVLTPYGTTAAPDAPLAVFAALRYWWMGEHGFPRIDTSEHVYFVNDQIGVRFLEELDFDYMAVDAAAVLLTPEE